LGKVKILSFLSVALLLSSLSSVAYASTGSLSNPAGEQPSYALKIQALKGPTSTDLYVNTTPTNAGIHPLNSLKKVQLKTFDKNNDLVYTRNYNNGVAAPNGSAEIQLNDVSRHQPLQTEVLVQNNQTTKTQVLKAQGIVLLRPELSIDQVDTLSTGYVNTPINVSTIIKELNGDLGANFTVQILNGDTMLDQAENVQISSGGTQPVAFALKFSQPGTYKLRALISAVQPGEYDTKHNEKDFTIQVIQPNKTMHYSSSYYSTDYNYESDSNEYYYGNYHFNEVGSHDQFQLSAETPDVFTPSGTFTLQLHDSSGATFNQQFTNFNLSDNGSGYKYYSSYDSSTGGNLWITQSMYGTTINYSQYGGNYTYSENYDDYYGYTYTYNESFGTLFKANGQLSAHIELPSSSNINYGGNYTMDLNNLPDQIYTDYYNYYNYYSSYIYQYLNQVRGNSNGDTTWSTDSLQ
jgi:hypothetical protein